MVKVKEDMTGWKMWEHGVSDSRLTVIKQVEDYIQPNGIHRARYLCKCECGNDVIARNDAIKDGSVKSCGCLMIETSTQIGRDSKKYNKYDLSGEYGIGWTSNTNKEFYFDLEDYDKIKKYCWYENSVNGKYSRIQTVDPDNHKSTIKLHQLLGFKCGDHINRNTFDNRKINLRQATTAENSYNKSIRSDNTSGVIGVSFGKHVNKWIVQLSVNQHNMYLGCFTEIDDAIRTRLNAEVKYFGEFAPQKHLFKEYGIEVG
jgi:hypothetical protein